MIYRRWLGGILVAVIASLLASCDGPVAPTNGVVETVNLSSSPASFQWQSPGLLGTPLFGASGTEPIGPCGSFVRSFGAGDQTITIGSATASRSFDLQAPANGQPHAELILVITADGGITSVDRDHVPPSPFCP